MMTAATKLSVNTPIAISFELVANRLHLPNDGRIVRACVGPRLSRSLYRLTATSWLIPHL
jgi:hypothetical protein